MNGLQEFRGILTPFHIRLLGGKKINRIQIEMEIQPNKIYSLEQLSAGQRAISSIYLFVSLIQINQRAFCVFDDLFEYIDHKSALLYNRILKRIVEMGTQTIFTINKNTLAIGVKIDKLVVLRREKEIKNTY